MIADYHDRFGTGVASLFLDKFFSGLDTYHDLPAIFRKILTAGLRQM